MLRITTFSKSLAWIEYGPSSSGLVEEVVLDQHVPSQRRVAPVADMDVHDGAVAEAAAADRDPVAAADLKALRVRGGAGAAPVVEEHAVDKDVRRDPVRPVAAWICG